MKALLLALALLSAATVLAPTAAALAFGAGPVGVSCSGPAVGFTLAVPPAVTATPPACTVTGLPG